MLELDNVCKNLGEFNLSNLNLKVNKGEYFMILGKSGAGKSLFLELITGMQNPDKGEIILDGINITHKKIKIMFRKKINVLQTEIKRMSKLPIQTKMSFKN